jgi:hypothetical protein
MTITGG